MSSIYQFFTKISSKDDLARVFRCNKCQQEVKAGTTSNLWTHLKYYSDTHADELKKLDSKPVENTLLQFIRIGPGKTGPSTGIETNKESGIEVLDSLTTSTPSKKRKVDMSPQSPKSPRCGLDGSISSTPKYGPQSLLQKERVYYLIRMIIKGEGNLLWRFI